mmetsp:Transcript_26179/g.67528  ORF Transcript_26179/g.67528 Transcript_26179/m.67528 type:complete len:205 (+) Transcript_26179:226-840(+)
MSSADTHTKPFQISHNTSTACGFSHAPRVNTWHSNETPSVRLPLVGLDMIGAESSATPISTSASAAYPKALRTRRVADTSAPTGRAAVASPQTSGAMRRVKLSWPLEFAKASSMRGCKHTDSGAWQVQLKTAGMPPKFSVSPAKTSTSPHLGTFSGAVRRGTGITAPAGGMTVQLPPSAGRRTSAVPRRTRTPDRKLMFCSGSS